MSEDTSDKVSGKDPNVIGNAKEAKAKKAEEEEEVNSMATEEVGSQNSDSMTLLFKNAKQQAK